MTWEAETKRDCPLEVGQIVRSKAGRDKGGIFLVLEVCDAKHVRIVDGRRRPTSRPKKKRVIHLQPYREVLSGWEGKDRDPVLDAWIRKKLMPYQAQKEEC